MESESDTREADRTSLAESPEGASEQQLMTRRQFTRRLAQLGVVVPIVVSVSLQAPKALGY